MESRFSFLYRNDFCDFSSLHLSPNVVTLEIRDSIYEFEKDINIQSIRKSGVSHCLWSME